MRIRHLTPFLTLLVFSAPTYAVESPYSGLENRDIKALSKKQIAGYLAGHGMRLALPGELNGFPGPKHVLEMEGKLGLSATQRASVEQVFTSMQSQAISLGEQIIEAEAVLDEAFSNGTINTKILQVSTRDIGLLKGRLRAVHLDAHLETTALLTKEQIQMYVGLRGYHHAGN